MQMKKHKEVRRNDIERLKHGCRKVEKTANA